MDLKDMFALGTGLVSVCVAAYAAYVARAASHHHRFTQKWLANHEMLGRTQLMLMDDPELLRVHGIQLDELSKDGISPREFVYIVAHLDAGSALHRIGGEKEVSLTQYRQHFLRQTKVRAIWKKYLRARMFNETPFTKAVDAFIAKMDAEDAASSACLAQPWISIGASDPNTDEHRTESMSTARQS